MGRESKKGKITEIARELDPSEPAESRLKQSPQARDFSSRVRSSTKTNVTSDFVK